MTDEENARRFWEAAALLPPRLSGILRRIPARTAAKAQEIRLRSGRAVALYLPEGHCFPDSDGVCTRSPTQNGVITGREDLLESFRALCGYSVHTHQHELEQGYLSLPGGHRAGVCGTMALGGGHGLRDVASINLRIARQIPGISLNLCRNLFADGLCGVLIVGAPSSGKTTFLRDMARTLADGMLGFYYKVAIVDERGELAAMSRGTAQNDVGLCADVLSGYGKALGIDMAVRTLSPQAVFCDEIGRADELDAVKMGLFSAVQFMTSAHCADREDFMRRPQIRGLIETGAFEKIVLLHGSEHPGEVKDIISVSEI